MANEVRFKSPFHDLNEHTQITINIQKQVYGKPGNPITLIYMDESGKAHAAVIHCALRDGKVVLGENLPPCFVESDSRRLENDIGYIRFNAFIPPVHEYFTEAMAGHRNKRALIIDIRGNHGGVWPIRKMLAENLVSDPALFCSYRSRERTNEIYLEPVENPYTGPLAVIVDVLSRVLQEMAQYSKGME